MFRSDGCATMYGGGDLEMAAYSLVNRLVAAGVAMLEVVEEVVGVVERMRRRGLYR